MAPINDSPSSQDASCQGKKRESAECIQKISREKISAGEKIREGPSRLKKSENRAGWGSDAAIL